MQTDAVARPSLVALGKRPASASPTDSAHDVSESAGIPLKRRRTDAPEENASFQPGPSISSSRVIVPGLPSDIFRSPTAPLPDDNEDEPPGELEDEDYPTPPSRPTDSARSPSIRAETYEIRPEAERIVPASTLQDLLGRAPSPRRYNGARTAGSYHAEDDYNDYGNNGDDAEDTSAKRTGVTLNRLASSTSASPDLTASTSRFVDLTATSSRTVRREPSRTRAVSSSSSLSASSDSSLPMPPGVPRARPPGTSSISAIVVGDSPTPPLRPLASPQARMEAAENGRIGAFGKQASLGNESTEATSKGEEKEEKKVTLGELQCPICLGSPAPLVLTECGHAL